MDVVTFSLNSLINEYARLTYLEKSSIIISIVNSSSNKCEIFPSYRVSHSEECKVNQI